MTEAEIRAKVVSTAQSYLGYKESDGSHKTIIDLYNSHKPLARGYKVKYTDAWCATFVSAIAVKCGYTDIMPTECSCGKMIDLYKKLGRWQEDDSYVPQPGDIVMYDWADDGKGDNKGAPDHVGFVESISGTTLTIIEGNHDGSDADKIDGVERRTIKVNGKYIRGYCLPDYASKATTAIATITESKSTKVTVELDMLKNGSKGSQVKTLQMLLIAHGFDCGKYGADGSFGNSTLKAVKSFQKAKKLDQDGVVGKQTWAAILGA